MKNKLAILSGSALAFAPMLAFAQVTVQGPAAAGCNLATIGGFICKVGQLINAVVPVLIALGVLYFVLGVISYVIADDEEAKTKGRDRMIYGIIGLAVIIGMWGLVAVLRNTFGLNNAQNVYTPTFTLPSSSQ